MTGAPAVRLGQGRALRGLGVAPQDIERLSMERLRARITVPLPPPPGDAVALRMAYAAGDPDLVGDVVIDGTAVEGAVAALRSRDDVLCDTRMVLAGVRAAAESLGVSAICPLDVQAFHDMGHSWASRDTNDAARASTRTARAMNRYLTQVRRPGILVVGNAPTALLAVLDLLGDGMRPPAALIATCPGLVAAAEAKQLLLDSRAALGVPVIAVTGSHGGSAVAAAAVNALCRLASAAH